MKKIIFIVLTGLILIFVGCVRKPHHWNNYPHEQVTDSMHYQNEVGEEYIVTGCGNYGNYYIEGCLPVFVYQDETDQNYIEIRNKILDIYNLYGIEINKKQLDIESELLKDNPDWEKIKIISDEIGRLESSARMELFKINFEHLE